MGFGDSSLSLGMTESWVEGEGKEMAIRKLKFELSDIFSESPFLFPH